MTRVTCTHEGHRYVLMVGEPYSRRGADRATCAVYRDGVHLGWDVVVFRRDAHRELVGAMYNAEGVTFAGEVDDPEALHMALDDALRDAYGLDTRRSA